MSYYEGHGFCQKKKEKKKKKEWNETDGRDDVQTCISRRSISYDEAHVKTR
jgi:hypothetical protein